jgi:hypothetical protein
VASAPVPAASVCVASTASPEKSRPVIDAPSRARESLINLPVVTHDGNLSMSASVSVETCCGPAGALKSETDIRVRERSVVMPMRAASVPQAPPLI